jgi:hypothetical protein
MPPCLPSLLRRSSFGYEGRELQRRHGGPSARFGECYFNTPGVEKIHKLSPLPHGYCGKNATICVFTAYPSAVRNLLIFLYYGGSSNFN